MQFGVRSLQALHHQTSPDIEILVVSPDPKYGGQLSPLSRIVDLSSDVSLCPTNSTMSVSYKTVCQFHVIHCSGRLPDNAMVSPMDIPNTVSIKLSLLSLHAPGSVSYCTTSMVSSRLGRQATKDHLGIWVRHEDSNSSLRLT